jgi:hypothetical protein
MLEDRTGGINQMQDTNYVIVVSASKLKCTITQPNQEGVYKLRIIAILEKYYDEKYVYFGVL